MKARSDDELTDSDNEEDQQKNKAKKPKKSNIQKIDKVYQRSAANKPGSFKFTMKKLLGIS